MSLPLDRINHILGEEVHFHFTHSHGHGGQNINKRKTKAELYFNIDASRYLSDREKAKLKIIAEHHVHHHSSTLILSCQEERYQKANKNKVIHHFMQLLNHIAT